MSARSNSQDRALTVRFGEWRIGEAFAPGLFLAVLAAGCFMAQPNAQAQSQVQILCKAHIERTGDRLNMFGYVRTDQPTTVDYEITVTTIAAANIGSTAQSGTISLAPNEPRRTSQVTVTILPGGYYEAELSATERLTGNQCSSKASSQV